VALEGGDTERSAGGARNGTAEESETARTAAWRFVSRLADGRKDSVQKNHALGVTETITGNTRHEIKQNPLEVRQV
jgi:hypothetical protein